MSSQRLFDRYRIAEGEPVTSAKLNLIIADLDARLADLSVLRHVVAQAIEEMRVLGLERIDVLLSPPLATILDQANVASQAVQDLLSSGLPAEGVAFTPAAGIAATNVQDAIVEVKSDVEASVAASLATVPSEDDVFALAIALG